MKAPFYFSVDFVFTEFGVNEVKTVAQHFHSTISSVIPNFDVDDVVSEWNMIRHILYKK